MRLFKEKPLHEKVIIAILLLLVSFSAFGFTYNLFSLNHAILNGDVKRVKLLLRLGYSVNGKTGLIGSPLYFAVGNDRKDLIDLLLSQGADINAKDKDDRTVLDHAISLDRRSVAKLLVEKGARLNACTLTWAAYKGNKELVELLIEKGLNVNASCRHGDIDTPLWSTIHNDFSEVAEILIDHGATINTSSYSPLHAAASSRAHKTIELLVRKGAKMNAKDQEGHTPLYYATKKEDIDGQRILIAAGGIRR
jgi:ankyrin repeat protein